MTGSTRAILSWSLWPTDRGRRPLLWLPGFGPRVAVLEWRPPVHDRESKPLELWTNPGSQPAIRLAPLRLVPLRTLSPFSESSVDDHLTGGFGLDPLAEIVVEVGPFHRNDQQGRHAGAGREILVSAIGLPAGAGRQVSGGELARRCVGRFRPEAHVHPTEHCNRRA